MKRYILLASLFFCANLFAQVPETFSFRSTVFEQDSIPLQNKNIRVEIALLATESDEAEALYAETHNVITNERGGYYLSIGLGDASEDFEGLSDVLWNEEGEKFLRAEVYDEDDTLLSRGITQMMSVPYALVAKEVLGGRSVASAEVDNIQALRDLDSYADGDLVYIKGYETLHDGGEGFFSYHANFSYSDNGGDDEGIIIKPTELNSGQNGRWLRHYDDFININFYGVNPEPLDTDNPASDRIQLAIDYAASNIEYENDPNGDELTKGNTIYFPNGVYVLDKTITLKDGVTLLGEGVNQTVFSPSSNGFTGNYMFDMEAGRVRLQLEKFQIDGNKRNGASVGGFHFKAQSIGSANGGLHNSTVKNIRIWDFNGHGIHSEAGETGIGSNPVNQFIVYENVIIQRRNDAKNCLRMTGQHGQHTFINCIFDGTRDGSGGHNSGISAGENVLIQTETLTRKASVISFINSSFQWGQYGVLMRKSYNVTFDNCWFEKTFRAIQARDAVQINVTDSRFSNAGGYGVLLPSNIGGEAGHCIVVGNTDINITRNSVLAGADNTVNGAEDAKFVYGNVNPDGKNTNTINLDDNWFDDILLSKTVGVRQTVDYNTGSLNLENKKLVYVNYTAQADITDIESMINPGELIIIRANYLNFSEPKDPIPLTFESSVSNGGNIYVNYNGSDSISLEHGQIATFVKIDGAGGESAFYQLVSASK